MTKVDNIDTTKFVLKTTYDIDKSDAEKRAKLAIGLLKNDPPGTKSELAAVENKIPDANSLVKKTNLNAKITEIENEIPCITGLATNSALTAVENKIPDVSSLVKKTTDYNTKISEIEKKVSDHNYDKYITTPEFDNLAASVFNSRLARANLVTKTDLDINLQSLNKKINSNKTKHLLVKTEFKRLEKFDAAYFRGKNYFDDDGT